MFYLPIRFFYYLMKLIIFTISSRTLCVFLPVELFKEKTFQPLKCGFRAMILGKIRPIFHGGSPGFSTIRHVFGVMGSISQV